MKNVQLHDEYFVADNAFGFEPEIEVTDKWQVLDRFLAAGFNSMSLSIATDMTSLSNTLHYLSDTANYIKANSHKYMLVQSPEDFKLAKQQQKLALSFMFQGTAPLEKNLHLVRIFHQLGVRSMIISYNVRNAMGNGCAELHDNGLSILGTELIKTMNDTGILIDCSHTGKQTSLDILKLSKDPVIFSHSNVAAICQHPRNLSDEQIKLCAKTGGFIGINGNGLLLGDSNASAKKYVDHIEYIINLVGDDHVGLGTDLVYFREIFDDFINKNHVVYPGNYNIADINTWKSIQPENLTNIIQEMQRRMFSKSTIAKVLGENYLRVISTTWK